MTEARKYTLRPLTESDQAFLWEMLYEAIHTPEGDARPDRSIVNHPDLAKYAADWGERDDLGVVAAETATGHPVGAAWLRRFTANDRGYGYVDDETPELSIAVLPGHRNRGLGTLMLRELLQQAQRRFPAVSLSVSKTSPAVELYARVGFGIAAESGASYTMLRRFPP